jgi:hypothetical protein
VASRRARSGSRDLRPKGERAGSGRTGRRLYGDGFDALSR